MSYEEENVCDEKTPSENGENDPANAVEQTAAHCCALAIMHKNHRRVCPKG
jgi:hypothetical protein